MSKVLLVQNIRMERPGYLVEILKNDGFEIVAVNAKHEQLSDKEFALVIILGAPESTNDDLVYLLAEQ